MTLMSQTSRIGQLIYLFRGAHVGFSKSWLQNGNHDPTQSIEWGTYYCMVLCYVVTIISFQKQVRKQPLKSSLPAYNIVFAFTFPETNITWESWNNYFPFGARPIFRGELSMLVLGRVHTGKHLPNDSTLGGPFRR